jgi:D-alanyl-D-alanine carboxypeptidase (penicillin-binding protein 5/6)
MAEHLSGSEGAFVEAMNEKAAELGMQDTHFVNCTGLDDDPEAAKHRTSAYDIALMSRELLTRHPDVKKFTTIWMDTIRNGEFGLSNTNKLVRFYSGATGLKTGFTSSAGYCLSATAEREGMELIAVVMGAETSKIRNAACKQLLDYGFANYALISPLPQGETTLEIKLGEAPNVALIPGAQPRLLIDKGLKGGITTDITLSEAVTAPVAAGQELGMLTVRSGDKILAQIPLVAATEVKRLTWGQLFRLVMQDIAMGS